MKTKLFLLIPTVMLGIAACNGGGSSGKEVSGEEFEAAGEKLEGKHTFKKAKVHGVTVFGSQTSTEDVEWEWKDNYWVSNTRPSETGDMNSNSVYAFYNGYINQGAQMGFTCKFYIEPFSVTVNGTVQGNAVKGEYKWNDQALLTYSHSINSMAGYSYETTINITYSA